MNKSIQSIDLLFWKIKVLVLDIKLRYLIIKNKYLRRRLDKLYGDWR